LTNICYLPEAGMRERFAAAGFQEIDCSFRGFFCGAWSMPKADAES
jgi:hypothetical protein